MIEESLNQLPFTKVTITTPTGASYEGLKYEKGNCGVSIIRSGEAMEQVKHLNVFTNVRRSFLKLGSVQLSVISQQAVV